MPKPPVDKKFESVIGPPGDFAAVRKRVKRYQFLVPEFIPYGGVTEVVALSGVGKSGFVLHGICRPVMTGKGTFFNGSPAPDKPSRVLWCDTENRAALTMIRLDDWNISDDNFKTPWEDEPLLAIDLEDDRDLLRIEYLAKYEGCHVIVIDSLTGAHQSDENSSKIGRKLRALADIAERAKPAIIVIHHTHKISDPTDIRPADSRGSGAIYSYCIAQLGIDVPDPDSDWCRVKVMKENLGLAPQPVGFRIHSEGIEYGAPPEVKRKPKGTKLEIICDWLTDYIGIGVWVDSAEVLKQTDAKGWARSTLQQARQKLDITKEAGNVEVAGGVTKWRIPEPKEEAAVIPFRVKT